MELFVDQCEYVCIHTWVKECYTWSRKDYYNHTLLFSADHCVNCAAIEATDATVKVPTIQMTIELRQ